MALETGVTYIEDLVDTNPVGATDYIDEGDDHIRNIKTAVQGSFPSLGAAAVTKTAAQINDLTQSTSGTATDLTLDTSVSGTAIDTTTLTDSATIIPSSAVVTDKTANLNKKIIEIGAWNMDSTAFVDVTHGLTLSKIRGISATILQDGSAAFYDFTGEAAVKATASDVRLTRATGGSFDTINFDSTTAPANRGWIIIQYTD